MLFYIIRRIIYFIIVLALVSITAFIIIQLPLGDFVTRYVVDQEASGIFFTEDEIMGLRREYGLDQPFSVQYFRWVGKLLKGDLGISLSWNRPVAEVIMQRLPITLALSLLTLLFTYVVAIPIGIYAATHQYSAGDYSLTVVGFVGLAIPNFLLALLLMFLFYKYCGLSVGGLFSQEFLVAPWSLAKFVDMMNHMWIAIIVIGTAGTASLIRVMRGCLLDELGKQYVITARTKGVGERTLLFKYPVRVAINPLISTVGWLLPSIVSGQTIVAIVLSLPTTGPLLLRGLMSEDMNVAGGIIMYLGFLTVIGTLISDLLLIWIDPRIRYEK